MYVNFISHNAKSSKSSEGVFNYLQKENEKLKDNSLLINNENFFSNDFDIIDNNGSDTKIEECIFNIDNNLSTNHKNEQSKFYVLNVSPSNNELKHLDAKATEILKERGLELNTNSDKDFELFYNEQKNIVTDILLKDYANDLMSVYADSMNREIYSDINNLPSAEEYKQLNKIISEKFDKFLESEGIVLDTNNYIEFDKFNSNIEFESGRLFNVYLEDIELRTDIYIPNKFYKIYNEKLLIEEKYLINKIDDLKSIASENNVELELSNYVESKNDFINYEKSEKYILKYEFKSFDKELKIYFNKDEVDLKSGAILIDEKTYQNKIYEAKANFLSKEFKDVKDNFFNDTLKNQGFDISKQKNEKGKIEYVNPSLVPSKNELQKIKTISSIEFNKYLVEKGYLEKKEEFKIVDKDTNTFIVAEVLLESDKAKLLNIYDERLGVSQNFWVPNFVLNNDKNSKEVILNKQGEVRINKEFYEYKINEELSKKNSEILSFENYSTSVSEISNKIKNKESLKFEISVNGLSNNVVFNIDKEDLQKDKNNNYVIQKSNYDYKLQKSIIENAKKEFSKEYKNIESRVLKDNLTSSKFLQTKEIEKDFKEFLQNKNILEKEINQNYEIKADVVKTENNSTLISMNVKDTDISFWVNNKSISSTTEQNIYFKNEREINKLIDSALERTQQNKTLIPIKINHNEFESKFVKNDNGEKIEQKIYEVKHNAPIGELKFKVAEKDLIIKNDEVFIEKGKLDYKLKIAEKNEIHVKYSEKKEEIKKEVWEEKGFNSNKRKLERKDLMYYAKIENQRTYKSSNKYDAKLISNNQEIQSRINQLLKNNNGQRTTSIKNLESQFHRDRYTNEIIKEGVVKGGNNKHIHIVVSKYDATMPKHLKTSLSPVSNQKESIMPNGKNVGFNRDEFFKKSEKLFDHKFDYSRAYENTYQYKNELSKMMKLGTGISKPLISEVVKEIQKEIKNPIAQLKQEINPIGKLKQELKFVPFPTSIPKSKLDLLIKVGKFIVQSVDKGLKM